MTTSTTQNQNSEWIIDPAHTTVSFSVRHLMITNVRGVFDAVRGSVRYRAESPEALALHAEIPVASVNTREPQRDAHLRSPDFFDAERHPTMTFRSTGVRTERQGALEIEGALTLRGVTREVTLSVTEVTGEQRDHNGMLRMGASATTKLRRSEFGITFNKVLEAGHLAIGDEVSITLDVSLLKSEAQ
jgi:polyisoprenoid-binding protein YceI